jgi:hypothetical protein
MGGSSFIPYKEDEFLKWTESFINYLAPRASQFNFPQEEVNSIQTQLADFREKLRIADDPNTRTPVAIQAKTTAHMLLEKTVRNDTGEYLTRNHLVSNDDRIALGLPIHDNKPTRAPVAEDAPEASAELPLPAVVEIHFGVRDSKSKAKPAGQHGAEITWVIAEDTPKSWKEFTHSSFSTRSHLRITFELEDRGKKLYFALRWENTRGEKGPWSEIHSTIIP